MLIQKSAKDIGQYNYTHWSDKPITPTCHEIFFVPQSIADGWEAYCSCGQWRGFENFYEIPDREQLINALKAEFEKHVHGAGQ